MQSLPTPQHSVPQLTAGEKYMVWSEHVRMLFQPPAGRAGELHQSELGAPSPFERRAAPLTPPSWPEGDEQQSTGASEVQHRYTDEDRFPVCFYARMLSNLALQGTAADGPLRGEGHSPRHLSLHGSDLLNFSSVSQPPNRGLSFRDHDDEAGRLASRLRQQAHRTRRAYERGPVGVAGSWGLTPGALPAAPLFGVAFADPAVEAVQAALQEEMTDLILSLREVNRRSAEARAQLVHSRVLSQLLPAAETASGSVTRDSDTDYESDFSD